MSLDLLLQSNIIAEQIKDQDHILLVTVQIGILHMLKGTPISDLNKAEGYLKDAS